MVKYSSLDEILRFAYVKDILTFRLYFTSLFISFVCFGMIGNTCLKSPDKANVIPPLDILRPLMTYKVL